MLDQISKTTIKDFLNRLGPKLLTETVKLDDFPVYLVNILLAMAAASLGGLASGILGFLLTLFINVFGKIFTWVGNWLLNSEFFKNIIKKFTREFPKFLANAIKGLMNKNK